MRGLFGYECLNGIVLGGVGAAFTLLLAEGLRLMFGNSMHALDSTIYGLMLVLFIIYMPKGILGGALEAMQREKPAPAGSQRA